MARYFPRLGRISTSKPRSNEQLTNEERKRRGLPHDGAKQAEKDRRRALVNQPFFRVPFRISKTFRVARAWPVVCQDPRGVI